MRAPRASGAGRRLVIGLSAALLLGALVVPAQSSDVAVRPADGVFTFDGRGFGHGRGLSQYGAYGAALRGLNHAQILGFYYAGTELGTAPGAQRRVLLTGEDADAVVTNTPGLQVRNEASGAVVATGGRTDWSRVRVRPEGTILWVEALQGGAWVAVMPPVSGPIRFEGPPVLSLHHPAGLRTYRGTLSAALSGQQGKPLYVISTVSLDDYVRGVVPAEMPSSWHAEALKAQAVAARSYGLQPCPQRTSYPTTTLYDVVDTTSCQVYGGAGVETANANSAVAATAGQVLRYAGAVLRTEFSAANGGWTVGTGGAYVAKPDPYDAVGADAARSTVHRWTGVRVPAGKIEQALGTGLLREVRVLDRDGNGEWGGRVLRVRLVGDSRTIEVTGEQLRFAAGLRSSWFDLVGISPIDSKHAALGGDAGLLGPPVTPETELVGGRFRHYRAGSIYWTAAAGAFEVHGAIRNRWSALGWELSPLGYPLTDELRAPDGIGRFSHFQGGSIYWTPATGAWAVQGEIRAAWSRLGWERSALAYPITDEIATPNRVGRFNHFQAGSIYWTPATGAHEVRGAIRNTWARLGWEGSAVGFPLTDELLTPDRIGRFNHFQAGSIYWTPATGAREVRGAIRDRWASTGWELGSLGYPLTDEYDVPGGRRNDFQRGSIVWDAATGQTRLLPQ